MQSAGPTLPILGLSALALAAGGLAAILASPPARAEVKEKKSVLYTSASTPLFDGPRGQVMGSVPPGTPLVRLDRKGRRVKVRIEAWSRGYAPLKLVADPTSLIPRAELVRIPDGVREVSEQKVDRYMARWEEVRLTAWVPVKGLVADVAEVWQAARDLQRERCTVCHEFKQPDLLNPSQWRGTLVIMSHRASLTPEEQALLSHYLQSNARPTSLE